VSGRTPDRQPGLRAAYRAAQAHLVAYEPVPAPSTREAILAASQQIARNLQAGVVDSSPPDPVIAKPPLLVNRTPIPEAPPRSAPRPPVVPVVVTPPSGDGGEFLLTDVEPDAEAPAPVKAAPSPAVEGAAGATSDRDAVHARRPPASTGADSVSVREGDAESMPGAGALAMEAVDTEPAEFVPMAVRRVDVPLDLELEPALEA
jgi:hypothetical protein